MPLTLLRSNQLEALTARLAESLRDSWQRSGDVFAADELIVPSAAIERYLTLELARRHGVCANLRCAFLASWLWQRIGQVVGGIAERSPLAAETLQWRILRAFSEAEIATLPRLSGYLAHADAWMRFELAAEVARLFERYATYRPDWLIAWAAGKEPAESQLGGDGVWQAALWQLLARELQLTARHPAETFIERLSEDEALRGQVLPWRLSLFALPEIPPLYLDLLAELAKLGMEIELYVLDPCREYWYEIVDTKRQIHLAGRGDAHAESGNTLLADWGRATRASLTLLLERLVPEREEESFVVPTGKSALAGLQRAMLELREPAPLEIPPDESIVVHACHGRRRQIEVLHDRLLDLFQRDATLQASEVVVLAPCLDELAPMIAAVFGAQPPARALPFCLTGLPAAQENLLLRAVDRLWALAETRIEAGAVLDLLAEPVLARRFGFTDEALATLRRWIDEAGIRWGLDDEDRRRAGLDGAGQHTFAYGLARLLLGYALPQTLQPVAGLLPAGDIEGHEGELLGRFAQTIDWLSAWVERLRQLHPASEWARLLRALLAEMIGDERDDDRSARMTDELQGALAHVALLERRWQDADFDGLLPLASIRQLGQQHGSDRALPQGVITFAPLAGLRALPYRVVCLLDMSDGVFPSGTRAREFDLMAARPRPGDRQRALEDRALFLDALLAARERLLIFYAGRSVRDDALLPPSVLVAQLMASLGDATQRRIEHPLQPFSRRYFTGGALFSYVAEYADALNHAQHGAPSAACLGGGDEESAGEEGWVQPPFLVGGSTSPDLPAGETIDCADVLRFLKAPARFWLRQRLGLTLPDPVVDVGEVEPLQPEAGSRRRLKSALLDWGVAMLSAAPMTAPAQLHGPALAYAEASGHLPAGALGRQMAETIWREIEPLLAALAPILTKPMRPPVSFTLPLQGGVTLSGALSTLRGGGLLAWGPQAPSVGRELGLWLEHLLLCALRPEGVTLQTRFWAPDEGLVLGELPRDQAHAHLATLVNLYRAARSVALPFFPRSAYAYAEVLTSKGDGNAALKAAMQSWIGGWGSRWCEADEAEHALLTRGLSDALTTPLPGSDGHSFTVIAKEVFGPLLEAAKKTAARM